MQPLIYEQRREPRRQADKLQNARMLFLLIMVAAVSTSMGYWLGVIHTTHHVLEVSNGGR